MKTRFSSLQKIKELIKYSKKYLENKKTPIDTLKILALKYAPIKSQLFFIKYGNLNIHEHFEEFEALFDKKESIKDKPQKPKK